MTLHAVVPAAGAGRRFGATLAKQYLPLAGQAIQQHTLDRLAGMPEIDLIIVPLAVDDAYGPVLPYAHPRRLHFTQGGGERMDSVLAGLDALIALGAQPMDWVLVHDVARPLVRPEDIRILLAAMTADDVGGLLANRVRDTMKRGDGFNRVTATVPREQLWHALTPQLFRIGLLHRALQAARVEGMLVTDEASAVERLGLTPRLVEGARDNLKITFPEDLALAEALLQAQRLAGVIPS